jgi:hypothetical protein
VAINPWFQRNDNRLPLFSEIVGHIDPSLMTLRLDQYFMRSVKEAPLSSHGDASMRHAQEKDAPQ